MSNRFFPSYDGYKITSPYGLRLLNGVEGFHHGIDLVAKMSSGISAVDFVTAHTGGKVIEATYNDVSGNYVKIDCGDGVQMLYCHFRDGSTVVEAGEVVKKGQILGYMGSTGRSTGAHLHFGIKVNGQYIDPEPYLDKDVVKEADTVTVTLSVLKKGAKGEEVKTLQRLLIAMGFSCGESGVDGSFGGATDKAVKEYQKANKLTIDGSVGAKTWESLLK